MRLQGGDHLPFHPRLAYPVLSRRSGGDLFVITSMVSFISARRVCGLIAIVFAGVAGAPAAAAPGGPPVPAVPASTAAERIYAAAPPRLLQLRTLVTGAERPSSTGSGFLVSAEGLAITNYHVVSQVALDPAAYRLQYIAADGHRGDATLLAIDLANDLAVVRVDKRDAPFFEFDEAAIAQGLPKGERLYSMGNPLDLGFTIIDGIYNGLVERSYNERLHFTGPLNPGMSGGPAVTAEGLVVGVNVSKRTGGAELVSFLVPARFAAALLRRVRDNPNPPPQAGEGREAADFRAEIGRQLAAWQAGLYASFGESGFRTIAFGPYQAPEAAAPWFTCAAQTNAGVIPKPRATVRSSNCRSDTSLFIAADLATGTIQLGHSYLATADLNPFQFAAFLSRQNQQPVFPILVGGPAYRKWYTMQRCHEDFVAMSGRPTSGGPMAGAPDRPPAAGPLPSRPLLRVVWCAQAYKEFEGLYDVALTAVTEDHGTQALVSRLSLQAVGYEAAVALSKRFLEAVQK
jgi:S1-C subfamily serine protease